MTSPARGQAKCETVSARGSRPTISGVTFPAMKSFNGGYGIGWIILLTPSPCSRGGLGRGQEPFRLRPPAAFGPCVQRCNARVTSPSPSPWTNLGQGAETEFLLALGLTSHSKGGACGGSYPNVWCEFCKGRCLYGSSWARGTADRILPGSWRCIRTDSRWAFRFSGRLWL